MRSPLEVVADPELEALAEPKLEALLDMLLDKAVESELETVVDWELETVADCELEDSELDASDLTAEEETSENADEDIAEEAEAIIVASENTDEVADTELAISERTEVEAGAELGSSENIEEDTFATGAGVSIGLADTIVYVSIIEETMSIVGTEPEDSMAEGVETELFDETNLDVALTESERVSKLDESMSDEMVAFKLALSVTDAEKSLVKVALSVAIRVELSELDTRVSLKTVELDGG